MFCYRFVWRMMRFTQRDPGKDKLCPYNGPTITLKAKSQWPYFQDQ
jgi:hypothetical protein